jgi:hypothetical protein
MAAGSEAVTALTLKTAVFWVVTPCMWQKSNVSEWHITSIFRIEDTAKNEKSRNRLSPVYTASTTMLIALNSCFYCSGVGFREGSGSSRFMKVRHYLG